MSRGSLLFAAYTTLLLHLLLLLPSSCSQTTSNITANKAHDISDCTHSCGNINISSPFRLKGDSQHCGNKSFELSCEAKRAVLSLYSGKYFVQEISYTTFRIRIVDAGVHKIKDNYFSHPLYSLTRFNFSNPSDIGFDYPYETVTIIFLSCENPMNPSDLIVETAPCINGISSYSSSNSSFFSSRTYSYFIVGRGPNSYNLGDSCKITLMAMVTPSSEDMTSCKAIYNEIAHGFQLSWIYYAEVSCLPNSNGNGIDCSPFQSQPPKEEGWFMKIIYFLEWKLEQGIYPIYIRFQLNRQPDTHALVILAVIYYALYLAAKFSFGFCCLTALLIYKWRRRHLSMYCYRRLSTE